PGRSGSVGAGAGSLPASDNSRSPRMCAWFRALPARTATRAPADTTVDSHARVAVNTHARVGVPDLDHAATVAAPAAHDLVDVAGEHACLLALQLPPHRGAGDSLCR